LNRINEAVSFRGSFSIHGYVLLREAGNVTPEA
jgi:hypothetical protein